MEIVMQKLKNPPLYFYVLLAYVVFGLTMDRYLFEWIQIVDNQLRTRQSLIDNPSDRSMFKFDRSLLERDRNKPSKPLILFWRPPFGEINLHSPHHCPGCLLTYDQTAISLADAVVFHCVEIRDTVRGLPTDGRTAGQRWVWLCMEPPWNVRYMYEKTLTPLNGVFNLTMTYRSDSDVLSSYMIEYPTISSEELERTIRSKNKTRALGAWLVSNCRSLQRREFIEELKRYIKIDEFGKCANRRVDSIHETVSKYKFYFAFENSLCKDYISEKFWRNALGSRAVPVVMGPPRGDYELVAPPKSFIHVDDFATTRELADYLLELDSDDAAYREYLQWMTDPGWKKEKRKLPAEAVALADSINWGTHNAVCQLCAKLLKTPKNKTVIVQELDQWWFGAGYKSSKVRFSVCQPNSGASGFSSHWKVTAIYSCVFLVAAALAFLVETRKNTFRRMFCKVPSLCIRRT